MKTLRFPGIKSIRYCLSDSAIVDHQGLYNQPEQVRLLNPMEEIPITGLASMEVLEERKTGETVYLTKLQFNMPVCKESEKIKAKIMSRNCCFVAENQKRISCLIGLKEKPHPVVTVTRINEDKAAGKVLYSVEITYTNNLPPNLIEN
jgi:hypothetical protein